MKKVFAFLVMIAAANAHHGYVAFDTSMEITFKGIVTEFHFVNPHCVVEFDVKKDKGQIQNWKAELTSANHLVPKGWTATSLEAGDEVTITGYGAKNGAFSLWTTKIRLAKGQELNLDTGN